jgi:hypothetical protein
VISKSFLCSVFLLLSFLHVVSVHATGSVAFWLAPHSNILLDEQVSGKVASLGGLIVLRASRNGPSADYEFADIVARVKKYAPQTPVLSYAWVNRSADKGRIEADLLRGAKLGKSLVDLEEAGQGNVKFLDIADAKVRQNVVNRLSAERKLLGVDGFAVDLSMRTPNVRPKSLAKLCQKQAGLCEKYSDGMDDIFAKLHMALGKGGILVYNGLFNFEPGQIEDQAKLLEQADGVAVEYFGMDPNEKVHSFTKDILPYLSIVPHLPKNKPVLTFARGPWTYSDYVTDYRWQRYLYISFLLAKRDGDLFKYHASFQIPAHKGRAGGLDVYADWDLPLGDVLGPFRMQDGLYKREFSRGMVVVAPDDGLGGKIRLAGAGYTPEGDLVSGEVRLSPGDALILFNKPNKENNRPVSHVFSAKNIAFWGWSNAKLNHTSEGDRLKLAKLPTKLIGEHDLLLDYERSLVPYEHLEISANLLDSSSAILAVAEVDDPNSKYSWMVVDVSSSQGKSGMPRMQDAPQFRSPYRKVNNEIWPNIHIEYMPNEKKPIVLDGSKVFSGTNYRFRRWSHIRFAGPLEVSEVSLSMPNRIKIQR